MNYAERNLIPNERIIRHTYGHWIAFAPSMAAVGVALALWVILPGFLASDPKLAAFGFDHFGPRGREFLGLILVGGVLWGGWDYLCWIASEFAITDHRILTKHGLIFRRTAELFLERVESVHVNQTISGRLMGFGTIEVVGIGETHEVLYRVPRPLEFRRLVQVQTDRIRSASYREMAPPQAAQPQAVAPERDSSPTEGMQTSNDSGDEAMGGADHATPP